MPRRETQKQKHNVLVEAYLSLVKKTTVVIKQQALELINLIL
jgi:hypothetical protein